MSYLLHAEGNSYSIIERVYERDIQTKRNVRLECVIESDLSFPRAKARLRQLIQQQTLEMQEASAPIGNNAPSDLMVLQSNAGFYVGRTFDGMPYERVSGYFPTQQLAQQHLNASIVH